MKEFAVQARETGSLAVVVDLERSERFTNIPAALRGCGKRRKIVKCQVCMRHKPGDDAEVISEGLAFCRPPDQFNVKEGAIRALRKALDSFFQSPRITNYFTSDDIFQLKRRIWNNFMKAKAWLLMRNPSKRS